MQILEKIIEKYQFKKVFNAPRFIYNTSRIKLPKVLAGIPKIKVSKTYSIVVQNIGELERRLIDNNLDFPFIIRKNGHHNARFIELIKNYDELSLLNTWFEDEKHIELVCIDYIDNPNSIGWYSKYRVFCVDGVFFPLHLLVSDSWCVKPNSRGFMKNNPITIEEDIKFIETFDDYFLPIYEESLSEMNKRIGLDCWGMDFTILKNGDLHVFEANSCMNLKLAKVDPLFEHSHHAKLKLLDKIENMLVGIE